jgi:hypothetical protein
MGKKKQLKLIRRLAQKVEPIPGVNHSRRMKKAFMKDGKLGLIGYLSAVDEFLNPNKDVSQSSSSPQA